MTTKATYSREDLLDAWLSHERSRDSHPDIVDYDYRRVWAMTGAFGGWGPRISFTRVPREHRQLWTVFHRSVEQYNAIHGPWAALLAGAADPARAEVEARHRAPIADAGDRLRAAYRALLLDCMQRIWNIRPDTTVSIDTIRAEGFDPDTPPPDLDLYG